MGVRDVYYSRRHRLGFLSRSLSPRIGAEDKPLKPVI